MKILVTGGSGRIGRYVVRELVQARHEVTSIDVIAPADVRCRTLRVDLTDAGEEGTRVLKRLGWVRIRLGFVVGRPESKIPKPKGRIGEYKWWS